ncbi:hypothetical protein L2E82_23028 [Cichorium intybus]|uniref:Uncharacterized protein n=1 Tax=Cichorium intybus TaxID=13427 RepID=A0ACB9DZ19_CICIN|nr:hypothetical protein L2E82_23028 [Cichorium intybus]
MCRSSIGETGFMQRNGRRLTVSEPRNQENLWRYIARESSERERERERKARRRLIVSVPDFISITLQA